jgi:hypothetical protein
MCRGEDRAMVLVVVVTGRNQQEVRSRLVQGPLETVDEIPLGDGVEPSR